MQKLASPEQPQAIGHCLWHCRQPGFLLMEHFVDENALKLHMQLPHTRTFFDAQLVAGVQVVDMPELDR